MASQQRIIDLNLPKSHPAQQAILKSDARFRVVVCGRRFGKTTLGERAILKRAAENGEACWWLSPTYDMADHVWRDLKAAVRDIPGVKISESDLRLDFAQGGWIAIRSTHHPDNLRGAGLDFVVLDEAAFMPPEIWSEIVRPMLVEKQGRALFLSSPNGKNWFYHLYLFGHPDTIPLLPKEPELSPQIESAEGSHAISPLPTQWGGAGGGELSDWQSWRFPTSENPLIQPAELDSIRLQTPEHIWLQEYQAEFTDSAGQVFRNIRACAVAPRNVQPVPGQRYVVGLDWGRENDYTAIVVMDAEKKSVVATDRFNQVNWSLQRGRLKAICDRWNPLVIYAESNSIGSPNIEALQSEGLPVRPFLTTAASKPDLIDSLSLALERQEIALQPDETLLSELAAYALERLPSGGYRYSAPVGLHDDLVIALALAWYAALHSSPGFSFA